MNSDLPIPNAERANRARKAIAGYNDEYDLTANIVDLLTDLQHYCNITHAVEIRHPTFDELLETSRNHFRAEINGEE